jgi:hypothetical protein
MQFYPRGVAPGASDGAGPSSSSSSFAGGSGLGVAGSSRSSIDFVSAGTSSSRGRSGNDLDAAGPSGSGASSSSSSSKKDAAGGEEPSTSGTVVEGSNGAEEDSKKANAGKKGEGDGPVSSGASDGQEQPVLPAVADAVVAKEAKEETLPVSEIFRNQFNKPFTRLVILYNFHVMIFFNTFPWSGLGIDCTCDDEEKKNLLSLGNIFVSLRS